MPLPVTDYIKPNEGAILLAELNLIRSPGENTPYLPEPHRFLLIKVIRTGAPAIYVENLGPARNFVGGQFSWPGGMWNEKTGEGDIWDTVGEMMGESEGMRHRTKAETQALFEATGYEYTEKTPEQWQDDYQEKADRLKMAASKKSVNGTHFSITR